MATTFQEPPWLAIARGYIGQREIPGKQSAPFIRRWLLQLRAWWTDDETPWCGVAVGAWMREAGQQLPKHWYRAKGWLDWGVPLRNPCVGCVAVFDRQGGGHVGLVVGVDKLGNLAILGGNQDNRVSIAVLPRVRALGYRWPSGYEYTFQPPPLVIGDFSRTEA